MCEIDYCAKENHTTLHVAVEDVDEPIHLEFCLVHLMHFEAHLCLATGQDIDLINGTYSGPMAHINDAIEYLDAVAAGKYERGN